MLDVCGIIRVAAECWSHPTAHTGNLLMAGCGNVILPHLALPASMSSGGLPMPTPRIWYIYILIDPRNDEVRYVGWSFNVAQRLSAHISTAPTTPSYKAHWIRQLFAAGLRPRCEIIDSGDGDWQAAERHWIAYYRTQGARLTNMTDGGDGTPGMRPSEQTREKMRRSHTGRKQSPEAIEKTAAALRGRKQSPEHIAKLSKARKGKIPQAALHAAIKVVRGKKQSLEHIERRIAPLRGRVWQNHKKPLIVDGIEYWECSSCGKHKIAADFTRSKGARNGLCSACRECTQKRWRNHH